MFRIFKKLVRPLLGKGLGRYRLMSRIYQALFDRLRPTGMVQLSIQGHQMYVDTADASLAPSLLMSGTWEPGTTQLFKKLLKPGMAVIDVGANIGYYTLIAADMVGDSGVVYAFEPEPRNCNLLDRNSRLNNYRNIIIVRQAVSDRLGKLGLALHPTGSGAHRLAVPEDVGHKQVISVETTSLDHFFEHINLSVGLVKIDVEGFEPAVWQGMASIVKRNPSLKLIIEFYPKIIEQCGYSPRNFLWEIQRAGFLIFKIDELSGETHHLEDIDSMLATLQPDAAFNILCQRSDLAIQ